jgi:hypothetical protein
MKDNQQQGQDKIQVRQREEKASFDSPGIYLPEAGKNERKHKGDERIFGLRFFHVKLPLEILPILPQRKTPCNESIAEGTDNPRRIKTTKMRKDKKTIHTFILY